VRKKLEGKQIEEVEKVMEEEPATASEPPTAGKRRRVRGREGRVAWRIMPEITTEE